MRKIIVGAFISLDGVMQGAGGPEEDFDFGGWSAPYYDEVLDNIAEKQKAQGNDILLGRKTFEIFASFFPNREDIWPGVNKINKYVLSETLEKSEWQNTFIIKNVEGVRALKNAEGSNIHIHGSGTMVQTLFHHDLVDEIWLLIHPVTIGMGKKLFGDGTIPAAFKLMECVTTPKGVIAAHYTRSGTLQRGSMGA